MSVHTGLPNGMELTVIAKAHLAVDVLLWLDMSVFLHWLKRSKYPQKCTQCSQFLFLRLQNDECILFCQSWETGDIQSEAKDEKERRSHEELYPPPPPPKEIKIKQQEKRKEYLQRWQSKSQRSDHNFLGLEYRNAYLTYISVTFSRADWQLDQTLPTPLGVCLFVKKYRHMSLQQTCIVSELSWRQEFTCPCYLVFFSLTAEVSCYVSVCMCLCWAQMQFLDPSLGTLLTVEMQFNSSGSNSYPS